MTDPVRGTAAHRPPTVLLPPELLRLLKAGDVPVATEELKALRRIVIPHDRYQSGLGRLARIHAAFDPHPLAEAGYLLIRGRSRSGKSHFLKRYAAMFPPRKGERGWIRRVLYVQAPASGGRAGLMKEILLRLGLTVTGHRDPDDLERAIRHHVREQEVELMILDEFQHVADQRSDRFQYMAADILKNFLSMNLCQMAFCGLDVSVKVLNVNSQFDGRLSDEFEVVPYDWNVPDDWGHYTDFLAELADQILALGLLSRRAPLDGEEFSRRLWLATAGLIGHTSRVVLKALDIALRAGAARLELGHLADAFENLKRPAIGENPFLGNLREGARPLDDALEPDNDDVGTEPDDATNLSKRKPGRRRAGFGR